MHEIVVQLLVYAGLLILTLGVLFLGMLITRHEQLTILPHMPATKATMANDLCQRIELAVEMNDDFHESLESTLPSGSWRG